MNRKEYLKKYYIENKEIILEYNKEWKTKNKEKISKCNKEYRENNKEKIKILQKNWYENNKEHLKIYNKKANYDTFAEQISCAEKVKNVDGFLQVRCAYCGKWYFPTTSSIQSRRKALNGQQNSVGTECRLYCSIECKEACPIYRKRLYQEGHPKVNENNQTREVQPELRQMVFERDNYICLKCNKNQDELNVPLHCHHIEGIVHNPIESADIDMCVTVCKECHFEIHQENGCGYNDMKCRRKI